jgi:putative ABC transport system permease protein
MHDIRHALRALARMPVLSIAVVLSLAVGIGVNVVVFSWIQARLLNPVPGVRDGASFRLVEPRTDSGQYPGMSWLEYLDVRAQAASFRDLIAFRMAPLYAGEPGAVERLYGLLVSSNYFSALGVQPVRGRTFGAADTAQPGREPVAIISYGLWQSRFGGRDDAIGQTFRVNGARLTVVGVAPREFQGTAFGLYFDVWLPATLAPVMTPGSNELDDRRIRGYSVMGKLRDGVSMAAAQSEVGAIMRRLGGAYPETNATTTAEVLAYTDSPRGPQRMLTGALVLLQGIMLVLLLAVCGNVANLLLARASTRKRDIGVRLALGAGRARIVRLMLSETILLALAGATLGSLLAVWGTRALLLIPITSVPVRFQTGIDAISLLFAASLGILCGLLFGAGPALQLSRVDPQVALRARARSPLRPLMRKTLMAVQVALALVVLIVAGLFFRSVIDAQTTDTGFRRDGVLLAAYDLAGREQSADRSRILAQRIIHDLAPAPGIDGVAIAAAVPLDIHGMPSRAFTVEGHARSDGGDDEATFNVVTPGYFAVMDIPFVAGRDFAGLSDTAAPPQAIVNEEFVRRYIGSGEPLGRRVQVRRRAYAIAGIVKNSLYNAFGEPATPALYLSYRDNPQPRGEIHMRTRPSSETAVAADVRRIVRDLDPDLPLFNVRSLSAHIETNLIFRRIPARMFAVIGPLLLILAAIGVYAVVAYLVSLRTTEIAVRLAVGASIPKLMTQSAGESLAAIAAGALAGWAIAFLIYADFFPGVPLDLSVFAGVPALLLGVASVAWWVPVRRATKLDVMVALRQE